MGRNAAFGRPPASERIRQWWGARSKTSRQNTYLALIVGVLFVAIVMAATARDQSTGTRRVIASRPQPTTTLALPTPSTVNVGDLTAAGGPLTAADLFGLSTTTTTPAPPATPAPVVTAPPATRPAPTVATTEAPRPATTVTNPDVVFSTVPPATTTTTQPPVATTTPTTTTTVPATTTTLVAPLNVTNLLAPA